MNLQTKQCYFGCRVALVRKVLVYGAKSSISVVFSWLLTRKDSSTVSAKPYRGSEGQSPACHRGEPAYIPAQYICDLQWNNRHWDEFISKYFDFPLSVSFHHCSTLIFVYISVTAVGRTGDCWKPSYRVALDRKLLSFFCHTDGCNILGKLTSQWATDFCCI